MGGRSKRGMADNCSAPLLRNALIIYKVYIMCTLSPLECLLLLCGPFSLPAPQDCPGTQALPQKPLFPTPPLLKPHCSHPAFSKARVGLGMGHRSPCGITLSPAPTSPQLHLHTDLVTGQMGSTKGLQERPRPCLHQHLLLFCGRHFRLLQRWGNKGTGAEKSRILHWDEGGSSGEDCSRGTGAGRTKLRYQAGGIW